MQYKITKENKGKLKRFKKTSALSQSKQYLLDRIAVVFDDLSFHLDVQELQHAVSAQQIASPHPYKKDYKEQIVGKGPHDPTIGYPEHDHHKKVGGLASSVRLILVLGEI